jgi:3-deoxy-D-manno-octulosonate 8-phosphate phosphatase (KDO 8-P phosphatase)
VDIRAIVVDCDGTLTNGDVVFFEDGRTARVFSTLDGLGFKLLKEHGIIVYILTGSKSQSIRHRANWLDVPCATSQDKAHWLKVFSASMDIPLENICMMGNDVIDLEAMKLCGLAVCPHDAHKDVLKYCHKHGYVTSNNGGRGAFRELCDFLIKLEFKV